jgi:succinyl-diaminopimelate desuccinylase
MRRTLVFAGHTDVVPTGPLEQWTSDPFVPAHRDGKLYGRGAADMKTSIAAFTCPVEEFLAAHPDPAIDRAADHQRRGRPGVDGTVVVCKVLEQRGERLDYCIVGEPSSVDRLGDMIKNGRRGSLGGKLTVRGVQGHIAYPQLGRTPSTWCCPRSTSWWRASGTAATPTSRPPASRSATSMAAPARATSCPARWSSTSTSASRPSGRPRGCSSACTRCSTRHGLDYDAGVDLGGLPFLTTPGALVGAVRQAIRAETGVETELSTTGGTSDGRFISRICPQVVEFGPVNATIHKIDEHVRVADIEPLKNIYRRTLELLEHVLRADPQSISRMIGTRPGSGDGCRVEPGDAIPP